MVDWRALENGNHSMAHGKHKHKHHKKHWVAYEKKETGLPTYKQSHLEKLIQKLSGHVQESGTPGYNDDRMVFMHTYQQYPQIIIHCVCETDVVAALKFARKSRLQVTMRSGGHCTAGYSVNDQVVIDTAGIDHVIVDPETPRVRCGPGVQFRKFNRVLEHYDLHVPGGGCESVCVAGYMMGGGYGFTSRLFGMNSDLVHAVKLVLADGRIVRASAEENEDLYWAVRGGTGGQFGVLIEVEYTPQRLDRKFFGFGLRYNLRHADEIQTACEVLELLQAEYSNSDSAPTKMGHQALLMYLPDSDEHPNGQIPCLNIRGLYDGSEHEAHAALGPLMDKLKDPRKDVDIWTHKHRYTKLNELLLQTVHPPGHDMPTVSMNTKPLVEGWIMAEHHSAQRWRDVVEHFLKAPDKTCFIAMEFYGAAINEKSPTESAFVHRNASMDLFSWAFWTFDTHRKLTEDWLDGLGEIAGPMGNGHRYQNYPRRGTKNVLHAYFGENLDRLKAIKARVDPHNIFDFEQSLGSTETLHGEAHND